MRTYGRKPVIGFFTHLISGITSFEEELWRGVYEKAKEKEYSLICFPGDNLRLDKEGNFSNPRNLIYRYATEETIDGLIVGSNSITSFVSPEEFKNFCRRYGKIPLVSIGGNPLDIPQVIFDNKKGMKAIISHLIETHNRKKIAFITGPMGNQDAIERFEAYQEVLKLYGIPFDEKLVYQGTFLVDSGFQAVEFFIKNKIDFDAVVASNDQMAFGSMNALKKYSIEIGDEVSVVGFDDVNDAQFTNPPLSTVKQPFYIQAAKACEVLIDILEGRKVDTHYILTPELVIRESCGCFSSKIQEIDTNIKLEGNFSSRQEIESYFLEKLKNILLEKEIVREIIDKLFDEVLGGKEIFIKTITSIIRNLIDRGKEGSISNLRNFLFLLRKVFLSFLNNEKLAIAENLFQKTFYIISEALLKVAVNRDSKKEEASSLLRNVLSSLSASFDIKILLSNFENALKSLNIPGAYIFLKERDKLKFLYGSFENSLIIPEETIFDENILLPDELVPKKEFYLIAFPLVYQDEHIGNLFLHTGNEFPFIYESIYGQMCSSIKGALLFEKIQEVERELEDKNRRLEELVIPMLENIESISKILQQREKTLTELSEITKQSAEDLSNMSSIIEDISSHANKMMEVIKIIEDISETINLVALNASIESTHAGEYGKGFSIIAREIKKLSDSTRRNSEEIAQTLKTLSQSIKSSHEASEKTLKTFKEEEAIIYQLLESLRTVWEGVKNLSESSNKILKMLSKK